MNFLYGIGAGAAGLLALQYGCSPRKNYENTVRDLRGQLAEREKTISDLQARVGQALASQAMFENEAKQLRVDLADSERRNTALEARVSQSVKKGALKREAQEPTEPIATNGAAPPPPPPMMTRKRARQNVLGAKEVLAKYVEYLDKHPDRLKAAKQALRLDTQTLQKSTINTIKASLSTIMCKWLKEEMIPEGVEPDDWEEAVEESFSKLQNEALYKYKLPNALQIVDEAVSYLRNQYLDQGQKLQGNMLGELAVRLAGRKPAT